MKWCSILMGIGILALVGIFCAASGYYLGWLSEPAMKRWILIATVVWFAVMIPIWGRRKMS